MADLAAHDQFARIRSWHIAKRMVLQWALVALALVTQWVPVIRDNVNYGLSVINVEDHPDIAFCDSIFVFCLVFLVETSTILQKGFGNVVIRNLGKLAPGIYLLAPSILYTIIPDVALSMHGSGLTSHSVLGVSWLVLFILCHALAVVFYILIEIPSHIAAEWWADAAMTGGFKGTGKRITQSELLSMRALAAQAGVEREPKSSVIA
jgi:hypothetical protein